MASSAPQILTQLSLQFFPSTGSCSIDIAAAIQLGRCGYIDISVEEQHHVDVLPDKICVTPTQPESSVASYAPPAPVRTSPPKPQVPIGGNGNGNGNGNSGNGNGNDNGNNNGGSSVNGNGNGNANSGNGNGNHNGNGNSDGSINGNGNGNHNSGSNNGNNNGNNNNNVIGYSKNNFGIINNGGSGNHNQGSNKDDEHNGGGSSTGSASHSTTTYTTTPVIALPEYCQKSTYEIDMTSIRGLSTADIEAHLAVLGLHLDVNVDLGLGLGELLGGLLGSGSSSRDDAVADAAVREALHHIYNVGCGRSLHAYPGAVRAQRVVADMPACLDACSVAAVRSGRALECVGATYRRSSSSSSSSNGAVTTTTTETEETNCWFVLGETHDILDINVSVELEMYDSLFIAA
ncbi:hypothetical protein PFICI_13615 [Pestalotiopsis fici W106-1]|uniref:Uncharacterized protein n=1 Tax=Pestalotiopsis fici (strain W106-1 / CGMCC3.15140) TaxID=1229662 RepID=W3WQM2_PESFW|nr:uncharacterized protein PFICI_13615 [Pestalotiopsis fici W106-1]ETS75131.1 hypothetical protein PFICI_13615 [Pestalotiopsis fici W106-1]